MKLRIIFFLICAFAFSASSEDRPNWNENWPHWRGPLMNGAAPLATPPLEWSEEKNNGGQLMIDLEICLHHGYRKWCQLRKIDLGLNLYIKVVGNDVCGC